MKQLPRNFRDQLSKRLGEPDGTVGNSAFDTFVADQNALGRLDIVVGDSPIKDSEKFLAVVDAIEDLRSTLALLDEMSIGVQI